MRPVLRAVLFIAVFAALAASIPARLGAEIYTWVDRDGVIHIANRPGGKSPIIRRAGDTTPRILSKKPQTTHSGQYDGIIRQAAERYDLGFELVKAVIHAESAFNPCAVSEKGALGLMQLMPNTARDLGVRDTFDPEQNILAGSRYLKQMMLRYGDDLQLSLAAYNAGPSTVDRSGGVPPFPETHDYIRKVRKLMRVYGSTDGSGGRLYRVVKNGHVLITDRPIP